MKSSVGLPVPGPERQELGSHHFTLTVSQNLSERKSSSSSWIQRGDITGKPLPPDLARLAGRRRLTTDRSRNLRKSQGRKA